MKVAAVPPIWSSVEHGAKARTPPNADSEAFCSKPNFSQKGQDKTLFVSRCAQIPALLAFLGAVGGRLTWGIVGIFVGPVILGDAYQLVVQ